LEFSVFDDNDPTGTFYFGVAEVPLSPLVSDKMVSGEFSIKVLIFDYSRYCIGDT
jgi:hypothetical protein